MEKPFTDIHATAESQLDGKPLTIEDTRHIADARVLPETVENLILLGKALSKSLRYLEAIEAYSKALALNPDNPEALRLRAGRYLSTLQTKRAIEDFRRALETGGDALDCRYRMGLAFYFQGDYEKAMEEFSSVLFLADPEMEIALIYWHSLASLKARKDPSFLHREVAEEAVGHHYSYREGVSFLKGELTEDGLRKRAEAESCDMEYSMKMYALHVWKESRGKKDTLLKDILKRDEYWFCFSSLAAWQERRRALRGSP